jgi:hypothetical protein
MSWRPKSPRDDYYRSEQRESPYSDVQDVPIGLHVEDLCAYE